MNYIMIHQLCPPSTDDRIQMIPEKMQSVPKAFQNNLCVL